MSEAVETSSPPEWAINRSFGYVTGGLSVLGTVWIFMLMLLICADVAGLALFSRPLYGVVEMTEMTIVPVVFLQLAHALRHGRLTRADFFFSPLKRANPRAAALLDIPFLLVGAVIFGALTQLLWNELVMSWQSAEYFGTRGIFSAPTWPFNLLTTIGSAAVTVQFVIETAQIVATLKSMPRADRNRGVAMVTGGLILFIAALSLVIFGDFDRVTLGILATVFMLVMLMAGMHVPVVLCAVGVVAIWLIRDNPTVALNSLKTSATGTINKFDFGVVPLFVLMGMFTAISDIGRDAYQVAAWWTRRILGGLGIATVVANAIFAAVTGISIASSAIFSRVAVPQMVAHGYTPQFATGTVAGSSVLGMLLPPSLLLIIYGFVTETSVGKLFLAAIIPGLLLAVLFCITILLLARIRPDFVGQPSGNDDLPPETLASSARLLAPIALLVTVVLGGIYLGWFTPTQAGAIGAFATMVLTVIRGRLNRKNLWEVLHESGQITVSVLTLVIGASVFTKALVMSTLPAVMVEFTIASNFGFWGVMLLFVVVMIVMGMFLDPTSIIVITIPVIAPIVVALGTDIIGPEVLIWLGIITVIAVEMALLTPPFGISVFVVKSIVGDLCSLPRIFLGSLPYVVAMAVMILTCMVFPGIILALI
ncbi:TRAP transporter large permease subunit [Paracoccus caeni]|uniref:TRAP transporter large permease subunit n=1 Tax=Paracoccus caeni TaxID=657651 RepID=A0A934SK89_9RHOB|nr:TRAP transporter large permease subunit [Paracoccus caeni]MBK4216832.1 TRAP transporter large permease subunit [Paracoccus caeni]